MLRELKESVIKEVKEDLMTMSQQKEYHYRERYSKREPN